MIGRTRQFFMNAGSSYAPTSPAGGMLGLRSKPSTNAGFSESYEYEVQPSVFTTLRKGGAANRGQVDAIVFQGGRRFESTGRTWLQATFLQKK